MYYDPLLLSSVKPDFSVHSKLKKRPQIRKKLWFSVLVYSPSALSTHVDACVCDVTRDSDYLAGK